MTYTVNGTAYDYNSTTNQRIKGHFLDHNVLACVSDMVSDLMQAGAPDWDLESFENAYRDSCPECGGTDLREIGFEDAQMVADKLGLDVDDVDVDDYMECWDCGKIIEKSEIVTVPAEPYEYWIVNSHLGRDLQKRGEVVLERYGGWIWGRQTTGQSITLDAVIDNIAYSMEILDGQKNSWKRFI